MDTAGVTLSVSSSQYLDLLLSQLKEVVEKHTSSEVLELASQTLQLLCRTEFAFYSRVDFARSCIMDYLADKFQHEATEFLQVEELHPMTGV